MRIVMLAGLLGATPSWAADLWLGVDVANQYGTNSMQLPVNWVAQAQGPVRLARGSEIVDLRSAALELQRGAVGGEKTWSVREGSQPPIVFTLRYTEVEGEPARQIRVDLGGAEAPKATSLPLGDNQPVGQVLHHMRFAIEMSEADPVIKKAVIAQLKVSPPTVLFDARLENGGGMRIATLP